jgi:hypothetical protein
LVQQPRRTVPLVIVVLDDQGEPHVTLYATQTILSGQGRELVESTKTNLRDLDVE